MTTRAYLRISKYTEESGSIEKQRSRILEAEKAAGRKPEAVVFYVDENVSAFRDVKRPERDRLMADLCRGDRLVAMKVDRLARSVVDLGRIAEACEKIGADLQFTDDPIDASGPVGRFMLIIMGALGEFEAENTRQRVAASRKDFMQKGRHAAGPVPVGFKSVPNPDGSGRVVRPDPEMAPKVRAACFAVMDGSPIYVEGEKLGITRAYASRLFRNPRLCGMVPDGDGVVLVNGAPLITKDAQILTVAEFRELQEFLEKPEKKAWSRAEGYGRTLACPDTGVRLYRNKGYKKKRQADQYRCQPRCNHPDGSPRVGVQAPKTDEFIERFILETFGEHRFMESVVVDSSSERDELLAEVDFQIAQLNERMTGASKSVRRELNQTLMAAYDRRDEIEEMPTEKTTVTRDSGKTFADVWEAASFREREDMAAALGRFRVERGRGLPADRLIWEGIDPDRVRVNGREVSIGLALVGDRFVVEFLPMAA